MATPGDLEHEKIKLEMAKLELERRRLELQARQMDMDAQAQAQAQAASPEAASPDVQPQGPPPAPIRKAPKRRKPASSSGEIPAHRKPDRTALMAVFGGVLAMASIGGLLYFFGDRKKLGLDEPATSSPLDPTPTPTRSSADEELRQERERQAKLAALRQRQLDRSADERRRLREERRRQREREAEEQQQEKARQEREAELRLERARQERRQRDRKALSQATALRDTFNSNPTVTGFVLLADSVQAMIDAQETPETKTARALRRMLAEARKPLAAKLVKEIKGFSGVDTKARLIQRIEQLEKIGAEVPLELEQLRAKALGKRKRRRNGPRFEVTSKLGARIREGYLVKARLRNTGNRDANGLRVSVRFYSSAGAVVGEEMAKIPSKLGVDDDVSIRHVYSGPASSAVVRFSLHPSDPNEADPPRADQKPAKPSPPTKRQKLVAQARSRVTAWLRSRTLKKMACRQCKGTERGCPDRLCVRGFSGAALKRAFWDPMSPLYRQAAARDQWLATLAKHGRGPLPRWHKWAGLTLVIKQWHIRKVTVGSHEVSVVADIEWDGDAQDTAYTTYWIMSRGKLYLRSDYDKSPERLLGDR